jgi:hypothetical protein
LTNNNKETTKTQQNKTLKATAKTSLKQARTNNQTITKPIRKKERNKNNDNNETTTMTTMKQQQ